MGKVFWALWLLLFLSECGYSAILSDDLQHSIEVDINQWQIVIVAAIGYMAHSYENTYRKAAMLLVVLWALWIAVTDRLIGVPPLWLGGAGATFFIVWGLIAYRKIKRVQSLPEAGDAFRNPHSDPDRKVGG